MLFGLAVAEDIGRASPRFLTAGRAVWEGRAEAKDFDSTRGALDLNASLSSSKLSLSLSDSLKTLTERCNAWA